MFRWHSSESRTVSLGIVLCATVAGVLVGKPVAEVSPATIPATLPASAQAAPRYEFLVREGEEDPSPASDRWRVPKATFSANGDRLMTSSNGTAHVWTIPHMKPVVPPLRLKPTLDAADLSSDGTRLVTADGGGSLRAQRVGDAEPLWTRHHEGGYIDAMFSPDGRRLLVLERESRAARVLDAATGRQELAVEDERSRKLAGAVFTPDGTRIITNGWLGPTRVWLARTGAAIATLPPGNVYVLAVSPKGDRVAQARTGTVLISDTADGRVVAETQSDERRDTQEANLFAAAFSPDGGLVATVAEDVGLRMSDATTGRPVSRYFHLDEVAVNIRFTPDGAQAIAAGAGGASVWDVATGRRLAVMDKTIFGQHDAVAIALSRDGRYLAVNFGGPVELWERRK